MQRIWVDLGGLGEICFVVARNFPVHPALLSSSSCNLPFLRPNASFFTAFLGKRLIFNGTPSLTNADTPRNGQV